MAGTLGIGSKRRQGFVLIAAGIASLGMAGGLGLVVDLGRMYVVRSEAQAFVDAAALDAARELDGTATGLATAAAIPAYAASKWDVAQYKFRSVTTTFSASAAGPWAPAGSAGTDSAYVKVQTSVPVSLYFLPFVVGSERGNVGAKAVAAQVEKTTFPEGLFPFSPFAHNSGPPNFGLDKGTHYTLRWPANPKLTGPGSGNVCPGDASEHMIDVAEAGSASERGYIEETSSSVIRQTIINNYQSITKSVGDLLNLTGGAKQTQLDAIHERIQQDNDTSSETYAEYEAAGRGNGRRVIGVPINDGGTPPGTNHRMLGVGAFFLRRANTYGNGGGQAWCAEYIGAWVQGGRKKGVASGGSYAVRLVE